MSDVVAKMATHFAPADLATRVKTVLDQAGFDVLSASNGSEALEIYAERSGRIDAVVLDMTMPGMGGQEASGLIRKIRPEVPIIMSSGYTEVAEGRTDHDSTGLFIQKPYSASKLIESIRMALRRTKN